MRPIYLLGSAADRVCETTWQMEDILEAASIASVSLDAFHLTNNSTML